MTGVHWWQWWRHPPRNDASTIIGMQTRGAAVLAAVVVVVPGVLGWATGDVGRPWLYLLAMVLIAGAALVLLAAPGDPLDRRATAVAVLVPSVALVAGVYSAASSSAQAGTAVIGNLGGIVLAFACIRGRVVTAWAGLALSAVVTLVVDGLDGPQPAMVETVLPNVAVLVMATFFATVAWPRAKQIYALRHQTERQSAAEAAERAAIAVRAQQLEYLDERARPLLLRIAAGPIDTQVVAECGLVEAALRDGIRAPALDVPIITEAAWAARARGARVLLLDDRAPRGGDGAEPLEALHAAAVAALDRAGAGCDVTVRVLPSGRSRLATLTVDRGDGLQRWEFGHDGRLLTG
ncbi:hypothetical protein [Gordonia caeni]|uniref:Integral membrane protein n=1 Tax=Gordonia caeni TaxID=1007097 RepID=A0ABP7NT96_9ACTN